MITIAIDPGDRHVGWAVHREPEALEQPLVIADEVDAGLAIDHVRRLFKTARNYHQKVELVVEEYVLYPDKAAAQSWSPMKTSEMIGALRLLAKQYRVRCVMQGANIKKPTERQLKARKIERVGNGTHARDAELHLWYRVLRRQAEESAA